MFDCMIKENADVSLHDCRTNRVRYDDGSVTFCFPDGFYAAPGSDLPETDTMMTCRFIDKCRDNFTVYLYKKNRYGKTVRDDISETFVSAINNGRYVFEFVDTFRSYRCILFRGYIWFDREPYHRECEIEIRTDEIIYGRSNP